MALLLLSLVIVLGILHNTSVVKNADLGLPRGRTRAKSACDACAHEDARWPRMQAGQAYVADKTRMIVDGLME